LERLGIPVVEERDFRIASGQMIQRQLGAALFRYQGHAGGSPVIFGEEGDATLLGAVTLEALGFGLDPIRRELIPIPMLI
jgi:hypothetical protein